MTATRIPRPQMLVMSDLQFGRWGIKPDAVSLAAERILRVVEDVPIHLLILPGDLTSVGSKEEFDLLEQFLEILLDTGTTDRAGNTDRKPIAPLGVVFCPGNHDLVAAESQDPNRRFENYRSFLVRFYLKHWKRFGANKICCAPWLGISAPQNERPNNVPPSVDANDLWTVYSFRDQLSTIVLSLNSAAEIKAAQVTPKIEWDPVNALGYVDKDKQLNKALSALAALNLDPAVLPSIAVLHHNIAHGNPVPEKHVKAPGQVGLVRNYLELQRVLQSKKFDLVIHGHQHEPMTSVHQMFDSATARLFGIEAGSALTVLGAGSAGAKWEEMPEGGLLRFHVVQLDVMDPSTKRIIKYKTFSRVKEDGAEHHTWRYEYASEVDPELGRPSFTRYSLAERLQIVVSSTKTQAFDRLAAYCGSRLGAPILGVSLLWQDAQGQISVQASTLSVADQGFVGARFDETAHHVYEGEFAEIETLTLRPRISRRKRLSIDDLGFAQSQLSIQATIPTATYWFEVGNRERVGLRAYGRAGTDFNPLQLSADLRGLFQVILSVVAYWRLYDTGQLYSGAIERELANMGVKNPIEADAKVLGGLNEQWTASRTSVFGPELRYWSEEAYCSLEAKAYQAKRNVERLIVYSAIDEAIAAGESAKLNQRRADRPEESAFKPLTLDEVVAPVQLRLRALRPPPRSPGAAPAPQDCRIHPMLVAFWVPSGGTEVAAEELNQDVDLRYLLTRDQLEYCCSMATNPARKPLVVGEVRSLLQCEMKSYSNRIFDGISAYVCASASVFVSTNAYEEPLVAFTIDETRDFSHLKSEERNLVAKYKERVGSRSTLSDLERRFWVNPAEVGVYVAPLWGQRGVEAILQIQTSDVALIEMLRNTDFYAALDGIRLGLSQVATPIQAVTAAA